MVKVEALTADRKDEFYNVFKELMYDGYDNFSGKLIDYFLKNDYKEEVINFWFDRGYRQIFIAIDEISNKIMGFLVGDNTYGGVAFISWIGVKPEYRKQGIGSLLFSVYENFAKSKKAHIIELFTYERIKNFYEQLGFVEIGRRDVGFYGSQNIIMNKKIGEWSDENLV